MVVESQNETFSENYDRKREGLKLIRSIDAS